MSCFSVIAQEKEKPIESETVVIVKPYSPTAKASRKIKSEPQLQDSAVVQKRKLNYSINSVPVASTFSPIQGQANPLKKERRPSVYNSYIKGGFGNYLNVLGELYTSIELDKQSNLVGNVQHFSSQGGIDDIVLDNDFSTTALDLNYLKKTKNFEWKINLLGDRNALNWYGAPDGFQEESLNDGLDFKQIYSGAGVGASVSFYESAFKSMELSFVRFWDEYNSTENRFQLSPRLLFDIGEEQFEVTAALDYLGGEFTQNFDNEIDLEYHNLIAGVTPVFKFGSEHFGIDIGGTVTTWYDIENDETELFVYPKLYAAYAVEGDVIIPFIGADGGLEQNTYRNFVSGNPFVSPTLFIAPTNTLYHVFGGIKGNIASNVTYQLQAGYKDQENAAFFARNRPFQLISAIDEPYQYDNSFEVLYDDMQTIQVSGNVSAEINEDFDLSFYASYANYETENLPEVYNLPAVEASFVGTYDFTKQLSLGAEVFFVGERKAATYSFPADAPILGSTTLDAFVDFNINATYQITNQFSVFLNGNNLLGSYDRWINYPTQGIQVMGGLSYQFNLGK
ncbi:TonB-dependent receptor [Gangjinia marincola]|uniref:TonB-dependent receptor n=1 Tax=Gangjinia marincola TaxID=578463 RepID=A0ABN1MDM2_9FLAO